MLDALWGLQSVCKPPNPGGGTPEKCPRNPDSGRPARDTVVFREKWLSSQGWGPGRPTGRPKLPKTTKTAPIGPKTGRLMPMDAPNALVISKVYTNKLFLTFRIFSPGLLALLCLQTNVYPVGRTLTRRDAVGRPVKSFLPSFLPSFLLSFLPLSKKSVSIPLSASM